MIDYLVPDFFISPSPGGSGGMHTKVDRVRRAVSSIYRLHVGSDLSEMQSDFLLIEPLYFRMSQMFEEDDDSEDPDFRRWSERHLEALRARPATKILYCSEMEIFRWTGRFRKALLQICDAVTCNSNYQASLFEALNIKDTHRLIDPIPADEFKPLPKRLQVVAMGRISEIKGSPFIAELFKALAPTPMETVFVGGAGLWSEASEADLALEAEIRKHADVFHQNILPQFVPKAIGAASFFVGNTIHDVFSSCHAEALMSGCISVSGDHPIYAERPGFGVKTVDGSDRSSVPPVPILSGRPEEFSVRNVVATLEKLTKGFQKLPDPQLGQAAREWAVQNVSFDTFTSQLTTLLKVFY